MFISDKILAEEIFSHNYFLLLLLQVTNYLESFKVSVMSFMCVFIVLQMNWAQPAYC
jgi:hypothetical protein